MNMTCGCPGTTARHANTPVSKIESPTPKLSPIALGMLSLRTLQVKYINASERAGMNLEDHLPNEPSFIDSGVDSPCIASSQILRIQLS